MAFFSASVALRRFSKFEDGIPQPSTTRSGRKGHDARRDRERLDGLDDLVDLTAATVSTDMTFRFATVARSAAAVLDELTRDLPVGESRRIDLGAGFMAVVVEHLQDGPLGSLYSVAHYYECQKDLIADPDVVFLRHAEGWTPISYQDSLAYRVVARIREDGRPEVDERGQRELVRFCQVWLMNIKVQQNITIRGNR